MARFKWLVFVGKEVPLSTKDSHEPYRRATIEQALGELGFQRIEGRLWVLDTHPDSSAQDIREMILRQAGVEDEYDRGQQRLIVTQFIVRDSTTSVQSQFKPWLG